MQHIKTIALSFFIAHITLTTQTKEVHFTVVTPSYNNELYCFRNIQSVCMQTYPHWNMIIVNDASTDKTSELLHEIVESNNLQERITVIDNTERKGALQNLYDTIHQCPDHHVILTLDGDDWLATKHALERIAYEYANGTTWLTYGQFIFYPHCIEGFCGPFPSEILKDRLFRSYYWLSSHPRTFYAWLFKKIDRNDLLYEGKFFPMAWDLAMMYPMLEMASNGHIRCISDLLYVYNDNNPLNDHKKDLALQRNLGFFVATKPKYPAL